MLLRNLLLLITILRYFHDTLLGLGIDKLLHLVIAYLNSFFEKIGYFNIDFKEILFKIFKLT